MKTIIDNINGNKEIVKNISNKLKYYTTEDFLKDGKRYIKAIKEGRMSCIIQSVSSSGMSRVMKFNECTKHSKENRYLYLQFSCLFIALGYSQDKNKDGFRINGCGMDMVFATNYNIIHDLFRLGFINKETCATLAQQTPVKL